MICIYCGETDPICGFSDEHIWPKRLGGSHLPHDLFRTRAVCRDCNSKCGLFVDGPFIKSFFVTNEAVTSANAYLDPKKPTSVPITFLGLTNDLELQEDEVCERWLGPTGDHVYFFHKQDSDDWKSLSGGDILARKGKDKGHAYMNMTSVSQYWQHVALKSFHSAFPKAKRLVLNAGLDKNKEWTEEDYKFVPNPDSKDLKQKKHIEAISKHSDPYQHAGINIDMLFDRRFSMKLALGLGSNLFNSDFLDCDYTKKLRYELWNTSRTSDPNEIMGKPFISERDEENNLRLYGVDKNWTISLCEVQNSIMLIVSAPSGKLLSICVHPDWRSANLQLNHDLKRGISFTIAPQVQKMWELLTLEEIGLHNMKIKQSKIISEILQKQTPLEDLPPKENGIG